MNIKALKKVSTAITCCALISTIMLSTVISASATNGWGDVHMDTTQYSDVKKGNSYGIQIILKRLGYKDVGTVDGYFGTKTETAVKKYQKKKGLTVDGIVGNNTWAKLGAERKYSILRNILRNSDNADIGIYDTYSIKGSSTTTDCFFVNIGNDERCTYYNLWLCDNKYTGRGASGSYKLSSEAMVMNTRKTVDDYKKS